MADMTAVDMQRLWDLVHEGKSVQEIMQELQIEDIGVVNSALQKLIEEKNLTSPGAVIGEPAIDVRYNDDGISISPAMLAGKGFRPGDRFRLRMEKNRIILDKKK